MSHDPSRATEPTPPSSTSPATPSDHPVADLPSAGPSTPAAIPSRDEIDAAAARIAPYVRRTPVLDLAPGALELPQQPACLSLKLEQLQVTGTFKARGAFHLLLARDVPPSGVVAASGGNFGLAIAHAARTLGHAATIFVPELTGPAKRARLDALGADVIVSGAAYDDALVASRAHAAETGALLCHAFDQPEVVAGQGTCGREFHAQRPDLDTVLVAVGGGGLIGGIAAWYAGDARVLSVEGELTPALHAARAAGAPTEVAVSGITADALGARRVGDIAFAVAQAHVAQTLLVSDDAVRTAQRTLWDALRLVVEPSTATVLAALQTGAYRPAADERVGLVICGANTDPATLAG